MGTLVESSVPNPLPYLGFRTVEIGPVSTPQATGTFEARAGAKADIRGAIIPGAEQIVVCPAVIAPGGEYDGPPFHFGFFFRRPPAEWVPPENYRYGALWVQLAGSNSFGGPRGNWDPGYTNGTQYGQGYPDPNQMFDGLPGFRRCWLAAADQAMPHINPYGYGTPEAPDYTLDDQTPGRWPPGGYWVYNNWRTPGNTQQGSLRADAVWEGTSVRRGFPTHAGFVIRWVGASPLSLAAATTYERAQFDVLSWGASRSTIAAEQGPAGAVRKKRTPIGLIHG